MNMGEGGREGERCQTWMKHSLSGASGTALVSAAPHASAAMANRAAATAHGTDDIGAGGGGLRRAARVCKRKREGKGAGKGKVTSVYLVDGLYEPP